MHAFDTNPIYAMLHESIYCNGGGASAWAAERALRERFPGEFDVAEAAASDDPSRLVLFTGEMVFPFMFDEIAALRPLRPAAEILAAKDDWPRLYDADALNANDVPTACASYVEDAFVDFDLAAATAAEIRGARVWATSEYMHSGVREDGARIPRNSRGWRETRSRSDRRRATRRDATGERGCSARARLEAKRDESL